MAYRKVYLRIQCRGHDPQSPGSLDLTAFKNESRRLLQEGRLVAAETSRGMGICTATAKELSICSQPVEQAEGQITMTF